MIINHNLSAIFAQRQLKFNNWNVDKDIERLSSGMRINRSGDDASGLAVSEKMRTQIRGLRQAERNAEDGISFIQTTEGYLQESQDLLQRVRELAIQASNGIYTTEDRQLLQVEVSQLQNEMTRVARDGEFNTMRMLTGRFARTNADDMENPGAMWFHIGANMGQRIPAFIGDMSPQALKVTTMSVSSPNQSNSAVGIIDVALNTISKQRADLGAYQNRLEHAIKGINVGAENLQAAESRIRDTDMASQMVEYTKDRILGQAGNAMLAQANQKTQQVLQLLQ